MTTPEEVAAEIMDRREKAFTRQQFEDLPRLVDEIADAISKAERRGWERALEACLAHLPPVGIGIMFDQMRNAISALKPQGDK